MVLLGDRVLIRVLFGFYKLGVRHVLHFTLHPRGGSDAREDSAIVYIARCGEHEYEHDHQRDRAHT